MNPRVLRGLRSLFFAACLTTPVVFAAAQVQVQIAPAPPAVAPVKVAAPNKAQAAADVANGDDKKPEDPVDAEIEKEQKEIAKLEKELDGIKKNTPEHNLKEAEIKRKQRAVQQKVLTKQRQAQQELMAQAYQNGATLETDVEIDSVLDHARAYAAEGRYRDASVLWQHLLDGKPGLTDRLPAKSIGKAPRETSLVYRPVKDMIESEIAALPAEGLSDYRITADAEARALMAQAEGSPGSEVSALSEVVRRFFISSIGDDAAYRLACIYMDEWDFVTARRLLEKVANLHPDPSIPRGELVLRLALANAKAGDGTGAKEAFKSLEDAAAKQRDLMTPQVFEAVRKAVEAGSAMIAASGPVIGWPMALGTATRDGIMAGVPGKLVQGDRLWTELPVCQFDFKVPDLVPKAQYMSQPQGGPQGRNEIASRWEKGGWTPTAQVLLRDGKAFLKTHNELRWYDLANRKLVESIAQETIKLDSNSRIWNQVYYYGQQKPDTPQTTEEVAMFGDRSAKSMSIAGDTLYHIEGRLWSGGPNAQIMVWNGRGQSALQIVERLCAVDISEAGKGNRVKWRYPAEGSSQTDMRFLAAPTPVGERLLVPVMKGEDLYLNGVETATGKELWSSYLCKSPGGPTSRWATAGLSVIGSEAYVASGYGVVFALDASGGDVLWATRYPRSEPKNTNNQQVFWNGMGRPPLPGWAEDVVIPRGDKIIVMPSDAEQIYCFSRITGKRLWNASVKDDTRKISYCLGVLGDSLYVAGRGVVRRYDINGGKLKDETKFAFDSFGRGALTPQGVYLPLRDEIVRLDPQTLVPAGKLRIASSSKDPIGNVFCDGQHLLAAGLDRVYALADGELKMIELTKAIEKSDNGSLRMERAFLYEVVGNTAASVEDLRAAFKLLPDGDLKQGAAQRLLVGLLEMARKSPDNAAAVYDEAELVAAPIRQQVRVWLARGRHHVARNEHNEALNLFLRAAQDTSEALVLIDLTNGRLEARASLAAGAEIRDLVAKNPALADELARRGEASLKPHLELVEFEKTIADPSVEKPWTAALRRIEPRMVVAERQVKAAQGEADGLETERKRIEFDLGVEKTKPTGRLEALQKQQAENTTKAEAAKTALAKAKTELADVNKVVDAASAQQKDVTDRLADLKANRVNHADRLLALGNLYPGSTVQLRAHLLAARYLWNELQFERAELVLRDLASSNNRSIAAAGSVALALGYEQKQWLRQAHQGWSAVKKNFADVPVDHQGKQVNAGDLAQASLNTIKIAGDAGQLIDRRMPDPPYEKTWSHQHNGQYFLDMDEADPSQFLEDHLVMLNTSNSRLICKNVDSGQDVWSLSLQRTNNSSSSTTNGRIVAYNNYMFPGGRLTRHGHIGLLWSQDKLMAFGLAGGKQIWEVTALDSPDRQNRMGYYSPYGQAMSAVALGSGVLAEFGIGKDRGEAQVRALDIHTGKVRWLCELPNENIMGIGAAEGYVYAFTNNGNELILLDSLTGQRKGRVKFENRQPNFPILFTKHGLLAVRMGGVQLLNVPDGKAKWNLDTPQGNGMIFTGYLRVEPIDEDRVFILNGGVYVVDVKAGKILSQATGDLGRYVYDAAATPDGKEIIAIAYGNQNEQIINIIDTATGKIKSSINLGQRVGQQIQASKVAASGDLFPVLINDPPKDMGGGRKQYTNNATIAFYRKSDGQRLEVPMPGGPETLRVQNAQSPIVRGNVFMVLTYQNITAYRRTPNAPAMELKNYIPPPAPPEEKKDDKKGAEAKPIPGAPQLLPIPVPVQGGARVIIQGGGIKVEAKPQKPDEKKEDKKDGKKEEKKDEKQGAKAGKAKVVIDGAAIELELEGIVEGIIEIEIPKPEPAKKTEEKKEQKQEEKKN